MCVSHHPVNVWQGFGKRKNVVGMARPKKSKVAAREEEAVMRTSGAMTAGKDTGAGIKRKEPSGRLSPKLQAAEAELEDLYIEFLHGGSAGREKSSRTSSSSRSASTTPSCGAWMRRRRSSRVAALCCSSSASTRPRSSSSEPSLPLPRARPRATTPRLIGLHNSAVFSVWRWQ